jgi:hypothetical protein
MYFGFLCAKVLLTLFCSDLKGSLNKNLEDVQQIVAKNPLELGTGPDQDTTIDLALSTDIEKSTKDDEDDMDPDSAIGEGISDSQPLSGSQVFHHLQHTTNQSFKPVQLNLSETETSSNWEQVVPDTKINLEKKHVVLNAVTDNVDAKVAEFLNKMRTDKRFQVNLSSDLDRNTPNVVPNLTDTKVTFNTDFDSTISEEHFRQGLENSLDLSQN